MEQNELPNQDKHEPLGPIYQAIEYKPENRFRHKRLTLAILVVVLIIVSAVGFTIRDSSRNTPLVNTHPDRIRLIAAGDFIAHDSLNSSAKKMNGGYDYLQFMSNFKPIFAGADIRFCNQATVSAGDSFGISGYPIFNAPTQFAKDMAGLGCNLINTASNHSFDKGQAAIDATLNVWKNMPNLLAVSGENSSPAEQNTIHYFDVKGIRFAFLAYTTYSNTILPNDYGVSFYSDNLAKAQIGKAKQSGAQIIIVSMRWGTEYSPDINAEQIKDSQFLADQGVDLVLGHGPHELQTVKTLQGTSGKNTLVWYSLGNFISTQEPPETLFNCLAVVDFDKTTKKVTSTSCLPIYMHYEWTPAEAAADNLSARKNLHMYFLQDTNQALIDGNQLHTTVAAQESRLQKLLDESMGVPLIDRAVYSQ